MKKYLTTDEKLKAVNEMIDFNAHVWRAIDSESVFVQIRFESYRETVNWLYKIVVEEDKWIEKR